MSDPRDALYVAWTTTETRQEALRLAHGLVEAGLVACAQVDGEMTSVYAWEGKVHEDPEWRLTLKLPAHTLEAAEKWLRAHHPYDEPQWVAVRADRVAEGYGKWALGACPPQKG